MGNDLAGGIRVKNQARIAIKQLTVLAIAWRPRRNLRTDVPWQRQCIGLHGLQHGVDGSHLFARLDGLWIVLSVAPDVVCVVDTADQFGHGVQLVAMAQEQRNEHLFHERSGPPRADGTDTEIGQCCFPNRHFQIESVHGIDAVVPEVGRRVGPTGGTGIGIRHEQPTGIQVFLHDGLQGGILIRTVRKM